VVCIPKGTNVGCVFFVDIWEAFGKIAAAIFRTKTIEEF
jgi:hypothetical protein